MDAAQFLENLRELSLEEGRTYMQEHLVELTDLTDHEAVGNLLADEALRLLYSPFLSLKLAEVLIFFGEQTGHTLSHALGLKAKGDVLVQIGHYQAAMECLDAAGEEFMGMGDESNWARSRISWIVACASLGFVEKALDQANHALEVFLRNNETYWVLIIEHNTAWIYNHTARYQDELQLYEHILAIYPTLTDQDENFIKRAIAMTLVNQAICLALLGKFEQAYAIQQQARTDFIELAEESMVINCEINVADLDYTQGYYGSALRRYYQAYDRAMQSNVDNPLLLAELKVWTANCLVKLNRAQEACRLMEEAVRAYREIGTSLQTSNALLEYAATLVASSRVKEALSTLDEACTLFDQGGFEREASAARLQQSELLLETGAIAQAYYQAGLLKSYYESRSLVPHSVRANLVMTRALMNYAQPEAGTDQQLQSALLQKAAALCKETLSYAREHNLQEEVYKSYYLLGQLALAQNNKAEAIRYYRAAIVQIERILDDLVYDLSPSFLHATWTIYEEMIDLCLQLAQSERAFSYLERARSIALRQYLNKSRLSAGNEKVHEETISAPTASLQNLAALRLKTQYELRDWQEKYHTYNLLLEEAASSPSPTVNRDIIQAELKQCEMALSELFERFHLYQVDVPVPSQATQVKQRGKTRGPTYAAGHIDIKQLSQHLLPDQLLLAYFLKKDKLIIFSVTSTSLTIHESAAGMEQLESLLPLLHAHLDPRGWPDPEHPPQQVIQRLLQKLYEFLVAPVAALLPRPGGSLTIVPYGPLHALPFHTLFNGSQYLIERFQVNYLPAGSMLLHQHASTQRRQRRARNDSPLIFGFSQDGRLQRVRDEARTVAGLLDGRCYLDEAATISQLTRLVPHCALIHIATHGQSRLDAPNFSYVRLADGQFNAIDAFSLDLQGCELVTLSGCETGLALSGGGDEQLGLGRAFLAAGASSLVMSLWPVEDTATNKLMEFFYRRLLEGDSKIAALRAAQCHLLQQTSSIYTHPYFWAAFRLVGNGGPLYYKEDKERTEIQPLKK